MIGVVAWSKLDQALKEEFANSPCSVAKFERLAAYFAYGFRRYRRPGGSLACYPGAFSSNGRLCDAMEGFSRIAPLLAAWIASGRPDELALPDGSRVSPLSLLAEGLTSGTDPRHPGYWGELRDRDQRIVEAADIALSVGLAGERLARVLGPAATERALAWLRGGVDRKVIDNNWHLFPVTIWSILRNLDEKRLPDAAAITHYERFKTFHLGGGWFRDGPAGDVDYYNAWQMHYALYWIGHFLPQFDASFRRDALEKFIGSFRWLIGPEGFPIMGRSICYRMAAPAPLVLAALSGCEEAPPGLARRALDRVWSHFISRGAVRRGVPTQGYGKADLRFLDSYSGPASALWCLRSLIPALASRRDAPFWAAPEEPLPVERDSFERPISALGWIIRGEKESGEIEVIRPGGRDPAKVKLEAYPLWRRALDRCRGRPYRPGNFAAKFELSRYSALQPFCGYRG